MSNRLIAILLLASTAVFADKAGLTVHGSLQLDAAGIYSERTTFDSSLAYNGMNMLTLNVKTPHLKSAKVEGLLDVYQVYGEYAKLFEADSSDEKMVVISGKAPIVVDLRMLYGALYLPWVDITLGRQIVNYGKGMVLSPLDVFSTVDLFPGIIASFPTCFCCFDALTVNDAGTRFSFFALLFSIHLTQLFVDLLPSSVIAPFVVMIVYAARWRKILG